MHSDTRSLGSRLSVRRRSWTAVLLAVSVLAIPGARCADAGPTPILCKSNVRCSLVCA